MVRAVNGVEVREEGRVEDLEHGVISAPVLVVDLKVVEK